MIVLRVEASAIGRPALEQIKLMAHRFPGEHDLRLVTATGDLKFGPAWRYDGSDACLAAMSEFGDATLARG